MSATQRPGIDTGRTTSIALMDFETRAIHEGQEPDPATGAIITPIYQTSTYVQDAVGEHKGFDYSRVANPTRKALETALASLESAAHGVGFQSDADQVVGAKQFQRFSFGQGH